MRRKDIFERERAGEIISLDDPEYAKIADLITEAQKLIAEINTGYKTPQEVRELFARLTGAPIDPSFWMLAPFYTDFGKNIRVGKNVFINHCCEFMDRGGITLEDNAGRQAEPHLGRGRLPVAAGNAAQEVALRGREEDHVAAGALEHEAARRNHARCCDGNSRNQTQANIALHGEPRHRSGPGGAAACREGMGVDRA